MALTPEQLAQLTPGQRADYERSQADRAAARAQYAAAQRDMAARQEAALKQELRQNYPGTDADYERDWPEILKQHRVAMAAGLIPAKPRRAIGGI